MPKKLKSVNGNQEGETLNLFTASGYNWGGARPGAGRPKTSDRKAHSLRCNDAEWSAIQKLLAEMRGEATPKPKVETRKRKSSPRTKASSGTSGTRKTAVKARRKPTASGGATKGSGLDGGEDAIK